jgi:UDP-2,3-diacylglucosamine pyrophosphatase LpxH
MNYYFISDLHLGGDGILDKCEFKNELIYFLNKISRTPNTELIINGDFFDFWQIKQVKGIKKLTTTIKKHQELFDAFKKAGGKITITAIPGNHDNELACDKNFRKILKNYNINFVSEEFIKREINNKTIWIEHGHRFDFFNSFTNFKNPLDKPPSYHITNLITLKIPFLVKHENHEWLADIDSVHPLELVPKWFLSNYFYREMNVLLRIFLTPLLIFFTFSVLLAIFIMLIKAKLIPIPYLIMRFGIDLELLNTILNIIFTINISLVILSLLIYSPIKIFIKDLKRIMKNHGLLTNKNFKIHKIEQIIESAKEIIDNNPQIKIFILSHTHEEQLINYKNSIIINTGSWNKLLKECRSKLRLPPVYIPLYKLTYFHIYNRNNKIYIKHNTIPKKSNIKLTFFEKLSLFFQKNDKSREIPHKTILEI